MKSISRLLLLFFVSFFVFNACSSRSSITQPPGWEYQREAIRLNLKSDSRLNLYQGIPHTLLLCVYQLRDPNAFTQVREEKDGISKLLECSRFDPSVTRSKSFVVQPGEEISEAFDRAEGTKYVGIVAGYYLQKTNRITHLFHIPIIEEKKGGTLTQKPGVLNITVHLGPQEIQEVYTK
jgi:type VI secretion system VasD/TssJ family lipoprotein